MANRIEDCRRCELWRDATQPVKGAGPAGAAIMLVGEQPGNEEDLSGKPFVGPAGQILDQCLHAAGLNREAVFITNAVKHFKWEKRGKRRLHKRPTLGEVRACNIWLNLEIERIKPQVIVALGATAMRALLGRQLTIESARRQSLQHQSGTAVLASYHPSAILRAQGEDSLRMRESLVEDLKCALRLSDA